MEPVNFIVGSYYEAGLIQKWTRDIDRKSKVEKDNWIANHRPTETYKKLAYVA